MSPIAYSFAYQPIVDASQRSIVSFEALVRGKNNEPAYKILDSMSPEVLHLVDEDLRSAAISLSATLAIGCNLNLNLVPQNVVKSPSAISSTLEKAQLCGIEANRITLEITENEIIDDIKGFADMINQYRYSGIKFSIDDFGAGYAGLKLLADFQPESIKLDMQLVRDIESKGPRQAIVRGIARTCLDLGIDIIAEGVETTDEYWWFRSEGIDLFQGYLFAKPGFEQLPEAFFPATEFE